MGYVNRSTVTFMSSNGCRLGTCDAARNTGYGGPGKKCFEVPDNLKGETVARAPTYLSQCLL